MDSNFFLLNNDNLVPRDQVRITRLEASPYPDGHRVKVELDVTPFRERPNFEISMRDKAGKLIAGTSVVASMQFKMEFVLHLRGVSEPAGDYTLHVALYYDDINAPQDRQEIALHIASADSGTQGPPGA